MKRAYLVHVPEFVLIVDTDGGSWIGTLRDAQLEAESAAAGRMRLHEMTREELRRRGAEVPEGCWDPDREMTCAEIAADWPRVEVLENAERLGWYAALLLELVA